MTPLPEDGARPDGDGWVVGVHPVPARRRARFVSRRLILTAALVAVVLLMLIAAAPAAALVSGGIS